MLKKKIFFWLSTLFSLAPIGLGAADSQSYELRRESVHYSIDLRKRPFSFRDSLHPRFAGGPKRVCGRWLGNILNIFLQ